MPQYPHEQCYFTLDDGTNPGAIHTCGDPVRAHIHLDPSDKETLSISNLVVNFKCKVSTAISTGSGNNETTHRAKVYLFWFSTGIQQSEISFNTHQSWPVAFTFPWAVLPHPTQASFGPWDNFEYQPGGRLPPSWLQTHRHVQSITYYLEAVMTRHGRMMTHTDKKILEFNFSPPLEIANPAPIVEPGVPQEIARSSRLLDPDKRDEHYGLRERTKHLFSNDVDPTAKFWVSAHAPTVCCVGDTLPVTLHLQYNEQSTAATQPQLELLSIHARINDHAEFRVPRMTGSSDGNLVRTHDEKTDLFRGSLSPTLKAYDGMSLNEVIPLSLAPMFACSFSTFAIWRSYMLKISAVFRCAGKNFDVVLFRQPLTILPHRSLYRALPPPLSSPAMPSQSEPVRQSNAMHKEETPPVYVARPSAPPPSYNEDMKS